MEHRGLLEGYMPYEEFRSRYINVRRQEVKLTLDLEMPLCITTLLSSSEGSIFQLLDAANMQILPIVPGTAFTFIML